MSETTAHCPHCQQSFLLPAQACPGCGRDIQWFSDVVMLDVACPNMKYCPTYPLMYDSDRLHGLINRYCVSEFASCQRKQMMDRGTRPEPDLLPDGQRLN